MKPNNNLINQNQNMQKPTGELNAPKYDPRTRKYVEPKKPEEIKREETDF